MYLLTVKRLASDAAQLCLWWLSVTIDWMETPFPKKFCSSVKIYFLRGGNDAGRLEKWKQIEGEMTFQYQWCKKPRHHQDPLESTWSMENESLWLRESARPQPHLHHIYFNKNLSNQLLRSKLESLVIECCGRGVVIQWALPPSWDAADDGLLKSWAQFSWGKGGFPVTCFA